MLYPVIKARWLECWQRSIRKKKITNHEGDIAKWMPNIDFWNALKHFLTLTFFILRCIAFSLLRELIVLNERITRGTSLYYGLLLFTYKISQILVFSKFYVWRRRCALGSATMQFLILRIIFLIYFPNFPGLKSFDNFWGIDSCFLLVFDSYTKISCLESILALRDASIKLLVFPSIFPVLSLLATLEAHDI